MKGHTSPNGKSFMSKTMCKTKDAEKRAKKQADPKFVCAKCGKKVNKEKYVCKPEKLQNY